MKSNEEKRQANAEYWRQRAEKTKDISMRKAEKLIADMEREYKAASRNIELEVTDFLSQFAENEQMTLSNARKRLNANELKDFKMELEEYIRKGEENGISTDWTKQLESASLLHRIDRLQALKMQIDNQIETLAAYKEQGLNKTLGEVFEESYYRNIFDVQQMMGQGSAFAVLDERKIKQAVSKPWRYDGKTFSDSIWNNKEKLKYSLERTLTQGIIRGSAPRKIAEAIAKETGRELYATKRLVLTESAKMAEKASEEGYKELGVKEIEIVVALDERTCEVCGEMDGKHFPLDKSEGLTPPFHPNCRCTTVPYFNDEFTQGEERAARGEDSKTYYVPADMKYTEWKEKYVEFTQKDSIVKGAEFKEYSEKEINEIANITDEIANKYTGKKSKWSGNILINPSDGIYGKRWNCDISTMSETSAHIILHEQLHARSISYFNPKIYNEYAAIEEGAVQLLTQEISKLEKIEIVPSGYDELTEALRTINKKSALYENDLDFALNLFKIEPSERVNWLETKVYDKLFDSGTIEDISEISELLDLFR